MTEILPVGSVVAGYRIERILGAGGMGTVYLAQNPVLPRREAIKVLSTELSRDREFRARFIREADLAASLVHPNIVAIYRRGETEDGRLWIAMQYVDGTDADAALRARSVTASRASYIIGEVAKALDYAHRHHVVHRDVKPANFLLSNEAGTERVCLGDFGIARALDDVGLTMTGSVLATVPYAAPELLSGMPIDGRADVYSLGCSLFRLLTGRTPFDETTGVPAMMMAHLQQPPPRVTEVMPGLPRAWDAVIATAMAKDPEYRFQTAGDLATAAAAALRGQAVPMPAPPPSWWQHADGGRTSVAAGVAPVHPGTIPPPVVPTPQRRRPSTWIAVALAGAGLLIGGVAAVTVATRSGDTPSATQTTTSLPEPTADPVPVTDVKRLLLTQDEINAVIGVPMKLEYQMSRLGNDGNYLADPECAGPFAPGQATAFKGSGWQTSEQQGFVTPSNLQPPLPYQTYQVVVGFPSAGLAGEWGAAQPQRWQQCANRQMLLTPPGAKTVTINLGALVTAGDGTLTMTQSLEGAQNWVCGRALAIRNNIAIDTFACSPDGAVDQAVRVVTEIAAKVTG